MPYRISAAPALMRCGGEAMLKWREEYLDVTFENPMKAADTGTAVGVAAELWHRGYRDTAIERLTRAAARGGTERRPFPAADLDEALRVGSRYRRDPRNRADIVWRDSLEATVTLTLPPHRDDPTGEPVHFKGHLDQLRYAGGGVFELWDIKHSRRHEARDLPWVYLGQLALYLLAAEATLGVPVRMGGIISTREYLRRGVEDDLSAARVFAPLDISRKDCELIARLAVAEVARMRGGFPRLSPGVHCAWCPAMRLARCSAMFGDHDGEAN